MHSYKLQYFNIQGRAEIFRFMFAETGTEYEDIRIEGKDWPDRKKEMPFGQMPVLVVDGKHKIAQSGAIMRFLGRELKLCGESSVEQAYVDMISEAFADIFSKMPFMESDATKKKELMDKALESICPILTVIETKFKERKADFLVGKSVTYVDMQMMQLANALDAMAPGTMDQFPTLSKLRCNIAERPNIKAWIAKRPKTSM